MAVRLDWGANFEAGPPGVLFQTHLRQPISAQDVFSYDVSGDGQKSRSTQKWTSPNAAPLSIILNWASEMEKYNWPRDRGRFLPATWGRYFHR